MSDVPSIAVQTEQSVSGALRERLSVVIIAGAVEHEIRDCLESVKWADEIIVVNSQSKDRTAEIAREYTDKVFFRNWDGFSKQKQFALEQAKNEWILSLDSDERVSPELRTEIQTILTNGSAYDGYYIPRRNYFLGHWVKHCGWYPGYQLRFFRKSKARMNERLVHEAFLVEGPVGYLKNDIIHQTHPTIRITLEKINTYSSLKAEEKASRRPVTFLDLLLQPPMAFLHFFFLKQGFRDGVYGLMVSMIHALTVALTYLKIWEMQNVSGKP